MLQKENPTSSAATLFFGHYQFLVYTTQVNSAFRAR